MANSLNNDSIAEKLQWYRNNIVGTAQYLEQREPFSEEEKSTFFEMVNKLKDQITKDISKAESNEEEQTEFTKALTDVFGKLPTKDTDKERWIADTYSANEEILKYGDS